jgi:RNA polymerase sigma factor (sigma-70 family)
VPVAPLWEDAEQLYAHFASMVRLAHLLTGSAAIAEDVVQDAFIRVAPRLDSVANAKAYLRAAVVNGCRSASRRSTRVVRLRDEHEPVYDEAVVEFFDALSALSPRQRAAVVLRYYSDLPDDEIASLLGCAPATVRVLLHRALAKLRKAVDR